MSTGAFLSSEAAWFNLARHAMAIWEVMPDLFFYWGGWEGGGSQGWGGNGHYNLYPRFPNHCHFRWSPASRLTSLLRLLRMSLEVKSLLVPPRSCTCCDSPAFQVSSPDLRLVVLGSTKTPISACLYWLLLCLLFRHMPIPNPSLHDILQYHHFHSNYSRNKLFQIICIKSRFSLWLIMAVLPPV